MSAQVVWLSPNRLHLHHGPIDCILEAHGTSAEVGLALTTAAECFPAILPELVAELATLRRPLSATRPHLNSATAQRMRDACWPHRDVFITPMAAVAGSVADTLLHAMLACVPTLSKAFVNNGGDIAFHLAANERFRVAIADDPNQPAINAFVEIEENWPVRGVATSGWRGRSQSFGIADAVTTFAPSAACADAAATLIANAVNVNHPSIQRLPACVVKDDSDLGERLVTVFVPRLPPKYVASALTEGERVARSMVVAGLLHGAVLQCQGAIKIVRPLQGAVHHFSPFALLAA